MKPLSVHLIAAGAALSALNLIIPASAHAQQEAEWRVINPISPTVVPLYANMNSPFRSLGVMAIVTPTGPTPEELAHQQLLASTLTRARAQVLSPEALEPRLDGVICNGALQGPLGWSALCSNRWIHTGALFEVATQPAQSASSALTALNELDADSASGLRSELAQRVANTRLKLAVTKITAHSIELSAGGKSWQLPIRQVAD